MKMNEKYVGIFTEKGLSVDAKAGIAHGTYKGIAMTVTYTTCANSKAIVFNVPVISNGVALSQPVVDANFKKKPNISFARVERNALNLTSCFSIMTVNAVSNAVNSVLEQIYEFCSKLGYKSCCQDCLSEDYLSAFNHRSVGAILCPNCHSNVSGIMANSEHGEKSKKGNVFTGTIGAILGALIGVVAIVLIGMMGYIASIGGIIMAVCAIKGYELLSGKIGKLGIAISSAIIVIMVYVGHLASVSMIISRETSSDFFQVFPQVNSLISYFDMQSEFYQDLAMLYLYTGVGAVATIIGVAKSHKDKKVFHKL